MQLTIVIVWMVTRHLKKQPQNGGRELFLLNRFVVV